MLDIEGVKNKLIENLNNAVDDSAQSTINNTDRFFKCSQCDMSFERPSQLDYHKRSIHLGEKSQECHICGKRFFRKTDLKTHLNIHLKTNQFICNVCGREFSHVSNLIRHCRIHAGMKPYPCSVCGKRFTQVSSLVRHKKIHNEISNLENEEIRGVKKPTRRQHYCKICGDTFPFVSVLQQHEKLHSEASALENEIDNNENNNILANPITVDARDNESIDSSIINKPSCFSEDYNGAILRLVQTDLAQQLRELEANYEQATAHNFYANEPNESYQQFIGTDWEQSKFPNTEEVIEYSQNHTPRVRLVQNEEGEQFFELIRDPLDYVDMNRHVVNEQQTNHLGSANQHTQSPENDKLKSSKKRSANKSTDKIKDSKIKTEKYTCTVCDKKFSTTSNLKQHAGTHSLDQKKFHCKECGISFAWKSTLNKHLASNHRPDGPLKFVCEICPKVYCTLSQVNEHVKRDHLKERNHTCDQCGKSFFKKFDLKSHMRTHTKERPYICRICDKKFYHQSHIIRHERIHSGKRPYSCSICPKSFAQLSSLKVHKQRHQNERKMDILDYQNNEDDPMALNNF